MDIPILLGIVAFVLLAFALEWMPIDVVALSSLGLLLLFGLVTPQEAISGFSNPAVITVMMMFILSHGLISTGLISKFGHRIAMLAGHSFTPAALTLLLVCGVLSAFINNTAALAIFMPLGIQLSHHYQVSPSRLLLPLSYVSIVGGTCTLVGTSTNLLVGSLAERNGLPAFEVFEFLALGGILLIVGLVYTAAVPLRFLPPRSDTTSLTRKYSLSTFLTEIRVPRESRLVGRTVVDEQISDRFQLNVLEILRGEQKISIELRNTPLRAGDVLIVRGAAESIVAFREQYGLLLLTDIKLDDADLSDENNILAEIQLSPVSRLAGLSIKEIDFRRRYGVFVLALNRTGEMIRDKLASIPVRQWDILLVFGPRTRVGALLASEDFVSLQELDLKLHLTRRWWISVLVVPAVVLLAALGVMSILKASILGAIVLVVSRAITIQQAYEAINWTVIFLLAAILPLGLAMEKTGLATLIGNLIAGMGSIWGPLAVLSLIYLTTALLSEIVSNNSTAVLMVPIAITAANTLGLEVKPMLMAVAYAASASFLTPMGYQNNAMVFGPGGYRFRDYLIFGMPIKVAFWIISTLLIPLIWPLTTSP